MTPNTKMKNFFFILVLVSTSITSQVATPEKYELKIGLEILPRTKFLNGFGDLPTKDMKESFRTTQRSRIKVSYNFDEELKVYVSFQDIRTWGQQHHSNKDVSSTIFLQEGYFEYFYQKKIIYL